MEKIGYRTKGRLACSLAHNSKSEDSKNNSKTELESHLTFGCFGIACLEEQPVGDQGCQNTLSESEKSTNKVRCDTNDRGYE